MKTGCTVIQLHPKRKIQIELEKFLPGKCKMRGEMLIRFYWCYDYDNDVEDHGNLL